MLMAIIPGYIYTCDIIVHFAQFNVSSENKNDLIVLKTSSTPIRKFSSDRMML